MTHWIRYEHQGNQGFGTLEGDTITVHEGDMFAAPMATDVKIPVADIRLLTPTTPTKMPALWNNFHAMADKAGNAKPDHPLYFLKSPSSFLAGFESIKRPEGYDGKVVYEGELGIVMGKTCRNADTAAAADAIFGYTCINDVTAIEIIDADESFAQWTRAKSFDGFGVFGPVIATDLDPAQLNVVTVLNGDERQNYPISDMIIPPVDIVRLISSDMTLEAGDVICCGTSVGVGSMKKPSNTVEITIEGIGTLSNVFEN